MASKKEEPNTRVTNQFRNREVMVYDLASEGAQLTISIAPCAENLDGTGEWRAEVYARQAPEHPTLAETGGLPPFRPSEEPGEQPPLP